MRHWKPFTLVRTDRWIVVLSLLILLGCGLTRDSKPVVVPTGVTFHRDTLLRLGGRGDNWYMTWAADDSQVVSMCDGDWLNQWGTLRHTHVHRIIGGPDSFEREDLPNYPDFVGEAGSWFGYGIVSVEGALYATISKTPGHTARRQMIEDLNEEYVVVG